MGSGTGTGPKIKGSETGAFKILRT